MLKTISLERDVAGVPTNAFSVELASSDGSFGIKEFATGTVVATSGTAVTNVEAGRYEYVLDVDTNKVYIVSWKFVTNSGDDPIYQVDVVGPFIEGSIAATTEVRGIFAQETIGTLQIRITDFDGNAVDPELITLTVQDMSAVVQADDASVSLNAVPPEKVAGGFYVFDWLIPLAQPVGRYVVTWNYTVDGILNSERQEIIIADGSAGTMFYSGPRFALRNSLENLINCAQSIPVYHEQARPTADQKTYQFTKGRWNQTPGIRIYRNQEIMTGGVEVDYFKGVVTFEEELLVQDVVAADYTFKWFTDEQLDRFIENGLNMLNSFPPFKPAYSSATLFSAAPQFIPVVLYGAAVDALRTLMLCLQFQQPAQFFGGLDRAKDVFGNLETLKKNYSGTWEKLADNKKLGPYPGTRLVVVPEFTLPGGRSRWFRYLFSGGT